MLEHFQAFTWDRVYWVDHHNQPRIYHRVYIMISMPPEMMTLDVNAQRNLVQEFARQLHAAGLVDDHCETVVYPVSGPRLREIIFLPHLDDVSCFHLSILYTMYLAMVEHPTQDVSVPFANHKVFLALRKLYALYEARLLRFLQMVFSRPHHTVLFGPAFDSSFFNVRDATLDVYSLLDHGHLHLEERVKFDGLDGWQSCLSYSTFHPRSFQVSSKKSTLEEKPSIAHLTPKS